MPCTSLLSLFPKLWLLTSSFYVSERTLQGVVQMLCHWTRSGTLVPKQLSQGAANLCRFPKSTLALLSIAIGDPILQTTWTVLMREEMRKHILMAFSSVSYPFQTLLQSLKWKGTIQSINTQFWRFNNCVLSDVTEAQLGSLSQCTQLFLSNTKHCNTFNKATDNVNHCIITGKEQKGKLCPKRYECNLEITFKTVALAVIPATMTVRRNRVASKSGYKFIMWLNCSVAKYSPMLYHSKATENLHEIFQYAVYLKE